MTLVAGCEGESQLGVQLLESVAHRFQGRVQLLSSRVGEPEVEILVHREKKGMLLQFGESFVADLLGFGHLGQAFLTIVLYARKPNQYARKPNVDTERNPWLHFVEHHGKVTGVGQ